MRLELYLETFQLQAESFECTGNARPESQMCPSIWDIGIERRSSQASLAEVDSAGTSCITAGKWNTDDLNKASRE